MAVQIPGLTSLFTLPPLFGHILMQKLKNGLLQIINTTSKYSIFHHHLIHLPLYTAPYHRLFCAPPPLCWVCTLSRSHWGPPARPRLFLLSMDPLFDSLPVSKL